LETQQNPWLLIFISIALGLLVGLQRESVNSRTAGIRTFPLVSLTGTICGLLSVEFGGWILGAGFIAIAALMVVGIVQRIKSEDANTGMTTEIAVLLMYAIGAFLVFGQIAIPVVLAGVITVLLYAKEELHGWVDRFEAKDLRALVTFVLVSMVILPVLPDKTYDPYGSLNPRNIWLMVVLIVGISVTGYFLYKLAGKKAGVLLGGILGGLISSTATTMSYARMGVKSVPAAKIAGFVILTATAVSLARVIIEVAVVAPGSFSGFLYPLAAELGVMVLLIVGLYFRQSKEKLEMPEQGNPAQLKSALVFALLYGAISFVSAAVKDRFGDQGLYLVSLISGLTDLDAITLATAKMTEQKGIEVSLGWRLVMVAALSNLVFKGAMAVAIGNRRLGALIAPLFGILLATGLAIIFFWPS